MDPDTEVHIFKHHPIYLNKIYLLIQAVFDAVQLLFINTNNTDLR